MLSFLPKPLRLIIADYVSLEDLISNAQQLLSSEANPDAYQFLWEITNERLKLLNKHQVRVIREPNDEPAQILARTIQEQQKEIDALLNNKNIKNEQKKVLRSASEKKIHSIEQLISLDNQLNTINMKLINAAMVDTECSRVGIAFHLYGLGLTRLPVAFIDLLRGCTVRIWLNLGGNKLSSLPESLGNIPLLTWLHADKNKLSALPDTLGNCKLLIKLSVENNQLTTLPTTLNHCTNLTSLGIEHNHFETLPTLLRPILEKKGNEKYIASTHSMQSPRTLILAFKSLSVSLKENKPSTPKCVSPNNKSNRKSEKKHYSTKAL